MSNFFKNIHPLLRRGKRKDEYDDSNFAVLNALNYELTQAEQETISSKIHSSLESATGEFLDAWGAWFGVYRKDGWTDEYYRKRIIRELLLKRGTVPAIIEALVDFLEDNEATVTIYEPWRNIFYTNKSDLNGEDHLMGYYYRFAIIDISIDRPFPPEIVEVIQSFKPAGVLFYIRLDTSTNPNTQVVDSPYVYLDVNNKTEIEQWLGLKYDVRGNVNLNNQVRDVVDNDFFMTNDSHLNSEDVLTGSFNHSRGYLHLATNPTLTPFKPTAETTLSELNTALGESTQDMYLFTEHVDDRTASIKVPQIPKEGLGYAVAWSNHPDGSDMVRTYPNENTYSKSTEFQTLVGGVLPIRDEATAPNGFRFTGVNGEAGGFRIKNVITSNGEWTVSFKMRGSQNTAITCQMDIVDSPPQRFTTTADNSWKEFSMTVNVTNWNSISYNFVDFFNISWAHFFISDFKVEKSPVKTIYTPSPKDDPVKAEMQYVGVAPAESNNYADYTWYPITNSNTFLYVAFDVKSHIQTYFKSEYDMLRLTLSEEDAMNKLLGNPVISNRIRALVSPSSAINFKLSIYDVTDDAWFSLGTTKLDTYFQKNNIKFNRAVDYINTEGLMFFQLEFTRRNLETIVELDMLNFTFDCRLGDGYEIGLQSEVVALTDTPVNTIALSKSTVTVGIGETTTLSATLTPVTASVQTIEWAISDASIATVNASGKVTGLSEGRTTLTAYADDRRVLATCEINVVIRPTSITLSSTTIDFNT